MRRPISPRIPRTAGAASSLPAHGTVLSEPSHSPSRASRPAITTERHSEGVSLFLNVLLTSAVGYAIASTLDLLVAYGIGLGGLLLGGTVPGGLALGHLQWLGMRGQIADRKRWLLFSVVAWTLGNPLLLSIITPGRVLAFATHALLVSFLRAPRLGARRNIGLTFWIGASVFGAVVNGYAIQESRQVLDHGLTALLVLALGSGILIAAMQALVFAAVHGNFAITADRLASALGGVGRPAGVPVQPDARMRWVYGTVRVA